MTALIFCFDGTLNGRDDQHPTNIRKLHIGLRNSDQLSFYLPGPGNEDENDWLGETLGAAFGLNSSGIRDQALTALSAVYRPGDSIAAFGFSRGAMIARLFAASVCKNGVNGTDPGLVVLGCFDTVAAFLPFGPSQQGMFHDLHVSPKVRAAYHAVALDEDRAAFEPNLMNHRPGVSEVWFRGVHCDVGGGFADSRLSDVALDWMIKNVATHGIQAEVETAPDVSAPIGSNDGFWRRRTRDVLVKIDDRPSTVPPQRYMEGTS